ncbi:MAG: energy-coupling factor transporter transmembrane protein EcfT [Lachnospiraceae bacterium]|nr:energy-coupling factor transporter transmembrane protein EcfT [Lachnospiraceae bacterium]
MTGFKDFHPAILFFYYILVIFTTVITLNPVMVSLSLTGAVIYYGILSDRKDYIKSIIFYLLILMVISLTNPIFSHNGETVLIYINDNPITLESVIYGVFAGIMIVGIIFWCKCYEKVMTTDKFLYLFGRVIPKISITISMAIRFIPVFKRQAENVSDVQKIMGMEKKYGKIRGRLRVYESVLGWAMENSVETADAMSARGFGLKKRTSYSIFRFGVWDVILAAFLFLYMVLFIIGMINGIYDFRYYPTADRPNINSIDIIFYLLHGVLVSIPFIFSIICSITADKVLERA